MDVLLAQLLNTIDRLGQSFPSVYDRTVRAASTKVVFRLFVQPLDGYRPGHEFGLRNRNADRLLRNALLDYCAAANSVTSKNEDCSSIRSRLLAFQNADVESSHGNTHADFFVWVNPDLVNDDGELVFSSLD